MLVVSLRPGNAGADTNTAADHIDVLGRAIAQVPAAHRKKLLVRADGSGASHDLLDWLTEQGKIRGRTLHYSVGFAVTERVRDAIALIPKAVWAPALDTDGGARDGGDVAELTDLLELSTWPAGMRVIVRRERPHAGAQLTHGGRRRRLRLPATWPWATAILAAFERVAAIPAPG